MIPLYNGKNVFVVNGSGGNLYEVYGMHVYNGSGWHMYEGST